MVSVLKVLIYTSDLNESGGVSNYNRLLISEMKSEYHIVVRGDRKSSRLPTLLRLIIDYINFIVTLPKVDIVHHNISLGKGGVLRDVLVVPLSRMFGKKVMIFWHGWDVNTEAWIENRFLGVLKSLYFKADGMFVLSRQFGEVLKRWGYNGKVFNETTMVSSELMKEVDYTNLMALKDAKTEVNFLFISRLEKVKGLFVAIDTVKKLRDEGQSVRLFIAGEGSEKSRLTKLLEDKNYNFIEYVGVVSGSEKRELFLNSHILLFPTTHQEGMATVVLEAMCFGLVIVTRPMGGVVDFFNSDMGDLTLSTEAEEYAELVMKYVVDAALRSETSRYNHEYGMSRFLSKEVVARIENVYRQSLNEYR